MDQINNNREKSGNIDFRRSRLANSVVRVWIISSKLLCVSFIACTYKRIPIKTAEKKWQQNFAHYMSKGVFFSDAQGMLTLQSVVGFGRISNSFPVSMKRIGWKTAEQKRQHRLFKLLCMSLLPASIKMIRSKTAAKTWPARFPL